jgi:hypothetical protein
VVTRARRAEPTRKCKFAASSALHRASPTACYGPRAYPATMNGDLYEGLPADAALPSYAPAYPSPRRRGAAAASWPALLAAAALAALALTAILRASLARAGAPGEAWDGHSLPLDLALAARAAGTTEDALRAEAVRRAMRHAWHGYEAHAWGADELRPASRTGKSGVTGGMDGFSGLGASIVDAMSTLHVMGLTEEFERCVFYLVQSGVAPFSSHSSAPECHHAPPTT